MEQETVKKPVKGEEFLKKVAMRLTGGQNPEKSPEDEATEYKKKTEAAKAKSDYVTTVDTLANPPSVQVMREKREQELIDQGKAATTRAQDLEDREHTRLEKEAQDAAAAAATEQQKREAAEQKLHDQQNQLLLDKLEELKKSQKPWNEQLTEYLTFAETLAGKLGFQKVGAPRLASDDPHIALELAKLDLERSREERKFDLEMENSKREWDMKLLTFQREGAFKEKELALQAKKDEHLFSLPQAIGGAIAKGLIDHGAGGAASPGGISQKPQSTVKLYRIEVGQGQEGEFECPNCHTPVAIGPTSTEAQCVECNSRFPIARVPITEGTKEPLPPAKEEE